MGKAVLGTVTDLAGTRKAFAAENFGMRLRGGHSKGLLK